MYCIGVDSGTQSTKAVVLNVENGEIVADGRKRKTEAVLLRPAGRARAANGNHDTRETSECD